MATRNLIIVAVLVVVGLAGWRLFPRYELQPLGSGAAAYRLDRWTGRVDVVSLIGRDNDGYRATIRPVE